MFKNIKSNIIRIFRFKKLHITFVLLLLVSVVAILYVGYPAVKTWTSSFSPLSGQVIALDPGHGGFDVGAVSEDGSLLEKTISLDISLYLRDYLQQAGAFVVMTRESDVDLKGDATKNKKRTDFNNRLKLINESDADLIVSVHLNSIGSSRWSGAQTFYHSKSEDSQRLAKLIQDEFKSNLNTEREALTKDALIMLKNTNMPGALVEVGFLSNPEEARLLAMKEYQLKIAESIYHAILRYFDGDLAG
ncbi:N-acetylmuramoyl-L-alanine amidase CwlD [Chengkuizengella axinellae]|uniref:N-acetylmuramoyl-L-alanine amidase CwlD n=1 Tax=Chengkuizengella axinellae TaxID=3064388 RepID=A0ABT9J5M8_9BACL|nr:N-acetylmuramoyl-L-alanine amidase CwlD [Chengkuizengella sp. 2205SS18-9]MDP5276916.1 N-acetylmuramoyl-L-alanine amidase CwlD [Chengkuizengella sp. 2205SS18-9]